MASIVTVRSSFNRGLVSNATSSSYASIVPVQPIVYPSQPIGSGSNPLPPVAPNANSVVFQSRDNYIPFVFFGTGSGGIFNAKITAIEQGGTGSWVYRDLLEVACTCSAVTGASGLIISNSEYVVSTITVVSGTARNTIDGMGAGSPVLLTVDPMGASWILVQFKLGTATGANCLFKTI